MIYYYIEVYKKGETQNELIGWYRKMGSRTNITTRDNEIYYTENINRAQQIVDDFNNSGFIRDKDGHYSTPIALLKQIDRPKIKLNYKVKDEDEEEYNNIFSSNNNKGGDEE